MKTLISILSLSALLLLSDTADARGRYERGRSLYRRHCGSCLPMGWDWAPSSVDLRKRPPLRVMAKTWAPTKICTWLHRRSRKTTGQACYPGAIRSRDRLDILYYLYRRAQGDFKPPRLRRTVSFRRYKGVGFKSTLARRRETALKREKNRQLLLKMRDRSRRRYGPRKGQVVRPRPIRKRIPVRATPRKPTTRERR